MVLLSSCKKNISYPMNDEYFIPTEAEMLLFAKNLARAMTQGVIIFLHGELGAGKTTLVRGLLRGLGYQGNVKSPTYTMVEEYRLALGSVYHFDLYRIMDSEELEFIGIREYFRNSAVVLIEWPERGE